LRRFLVPLEANAENVLILNDAFIQKYKNKATIDADYVVDKAHKKPNPAAKDADIHVAGRAPKEIGLATVAEMMNAAEHARRLAGPRKQEEARGPQLESAL
jgi:hypothetical protein